MTPALHRFAAILIGVLATTPAAADSDEAHDFTKQCMSACARQGAPRAACAAMCECGLADVEQRPWWPPADMDDLDAKKLKIMNTVALQCALRELQGKP